MAFNFPNDPAVGQGEHGQVRTVPSCERIIDGVREIGEGVRRADDENASRPRPQLRAVPTEQFDGQ